MAGVQWVGSDGNRYIKDSSGTRNVGPATSEGGTWWIKNGYPMILDPNPGNTGATTDWGSSNANWYADESGSLLGASTERAGSAAGGGTTTYDPDAGLRASLKNEIAARCGETEGG